MQNYQKITFLNIKIYGKNVSILSCILQLFAVRLTGGVVKMVNLFNFIVKLKELK